jgi:hypothetical protein
MPCPLRESTKGRSKSKMNYFIKISAPAGLAIMFSGMHQLEIRECSGVDIVDSNHGYGVKYKLFENDRKQDGALKVCNSFPLNGKYPTG